MTEEKNRRGRKPKTLDLSQLIDADQIREPESPAFIMSCSICGSHRNIGVFKGKNVCTRCIQYIKDRQ